MPRPVERVTQMFCPNCGTQLGAGVNFCPECGTKVTATVAVVDARDNMLMLVSLGTCARTTAAALLQQVCGYDASDALLIVDSVPITVARSLTDAQARYLAQAFTEYGLEVSIYDGNGWREWESDKDSVWDSAGDLITSVAAALGLINLDNRITRDMMRRTDFPYRFSGVRPPVYRLNSTLRAVPPRRVAPVRPPIHRAPPVPPTPPMPPRPAVRPAPPAPPRPTPPAPPRPTPPAPPRPTPPAPPRPTPPAPTRPTSPVRNAAPAPIRPAKPAGPQPSGRPDGGPGRPGGSGRPGGAGRQGGPGRPGR